MYSIFLRLAQKRCAGGMPQLDTATFLHQYNWTLLTLLGIYALVVNSLLPTMHKNWGIRAVAQGEAQFFQALIEESDKERPEVKVLQSLFK